MTAWRHVAFERLATELAADAVLATYVDTVARVERIRDDELPDFTRHAIVIAPLGDPAAAPHSPSHNDERFACRLRLVIAGWEPANPLEHVTGTTVVGVGTSEVGMLKFAEDVRNALRRNDLSTLLEETGREADQELSYPSIPEREHCFTEADLTWVGEYMAAIDPSQRSE